jgi:hypothetical protein
MNSFKKERRILIHQGNFHTNTLGCLLPGSSYSNVNGNYVVWNSGSTLSLLRILLGNNAAQLIIKDID